VLEGRELQFVEAQCKMHGKLGKRRHVLYEQHVAVVENVVEYMFGRHYEGFTYTLRWQVGLVFLRVLVPAARAVPDKGPLWLLL